MDESVLWSLISTLLGNILPIYSSPECYLYDEPVASMVLYRVSALTKGSQSGVAMVTVSVAGLISTTMFSEGTPLRPRKSDVESKETNEGNHDVVSRLIILIVVILDRHGIW